MSHTNCSRHVVSCLNQSLLCIYDCDVVSPYEVEKRDPTQYYTPGVLYCKCFMCFADSNHVQSVHWRKSKFTPNLFKWGSEYISSIIIFHLNRLWKAKFFTLCDVVFLVRLQGEIQILITLGCERVDSQEWSISNLSWSLTRSNTSHSTIQYEAYSDERRLYYQFSLPHRLISFERWWENVRFELRRGRVDWLAYNITSGGIMTAMAIKAIDRTSHIMNRLFYDLTRNTRRYCTRLSHFSTNDS